MAKKLSPFEEAFKEARAEGKKTFTFNGKKYGTVTADDEQKRIDKMPARVSEPTEIQAGTRYVNFPHTPTPSTTRARSLVDQGRGVQLYKDVDKEAVLNAGLGLASLYPGTVAARAAYGVARPLVGAAAKYLSKKDSSTASKAKDEDPPLFTSKEKPERGVFDDVSPREFKKGGSVKLSEAARRGDGIAIRGRTKGRLC
jgi:hypothetical protein